MNIYLIRHGETDWNRTGRLQGHTDIPLNEKGEEQMQGVAETIDGMGVKIDRIFASPLLRARKSAEIIADKLRYPKECICVEEMLIECCFGAGEGMTEAERKQRYPDGIYPGRESFEDLVKRAHTAFDRIRTACNGTEHVLVVSHGMFLYALLMAVTGRKKVCGVSSGPTFEQGSVYRVAVEGKDAAVTKYREGRFMDYTSFCLI